jgi:hypothetical protein
MIGDQYTFLTNHVAYQRVVLRDIHIIVVAARSLVGYQPVFRLQQKLCAGRRQGHIAELIDDQQLVGRQLAL